VTQQRAATPEPSEIAGRYQVVQKLGAGAFGTVYKAKDKILGRMVAIKTIRLDGLAASAASLDELLARFKREAQVSAQLKHPNIVTIYDIGEAEGLSYLAMEFIDGVGLDKLIASAGRLPLERAAAIGAQIAEALDYAHKNNVVHRDIKPANVMIESGDRVKVTDFGIAKAIDSGDHLTVTGSLLGTPSYMSPEQARGAAIDGRSDLFAVGCIVYEMLVGRKAFRGDSITALIFKIITEEPQPIREIDPSVPESVTKIIARAISKAPETRYQNGRELAADLLGLASPAAVPTIRQVETPTVKAPTVDGDATRVTGGPAVPPQTQVSAARTAGAPPPPPRPLGAPAPRPAPAKRSTAPILAVVAVLGLGLLGLAAGGTWFFFLRTPSPTPVPSEATGTAPEGGVQVASSSPAESLGSEPGSSQTSSQPTPEAVQPPSSGQATSTTSVNPPPSTPPQRVASAAETGARPVPPPQTGTTAGAAEGGGSPDFAFLDQEVDQQADGREAGQRVAEQFGSGGSSRGGSFGTQSRLRMRARSPQPRNGGERAAIATMRFLMNAQERFNQRAGHYGNLSEIGAGLSRFLDVPFQAHGFQRRGYRFNLATEADSFSLTASPQVAGMRSFVGDDSGFIRLAEE
jgi:serine/threonine protein kinase